MFSSFEAEPCVLVMVRVGSSHIDDVDILVFGELFIRAVCGNLAWDFEFLDELFGSIGRGRGRNCLDFVLDVRDIAC